MFMSLVDGQFVLIFTHHCL